MAGGFGLMVHIMMMMRMALLLDDSFRLQSVAGNLPLQNFYIYYYLVLAAQFPQHKY